MKYAIVLAAGRGTRMKSSKNKVMHKILNKPIIGHVVDNLNRVDLDELVVVTGYQNEEVETYLGDRASYAYQAVQLGTGDAVSKVDLLKDKKGSTLLLLGDCALLSPNTINKIFEKHEGYDLTLVSASTPNPGLSRRIVRDNQGDIDRIVDYRNLSESEQYITEISLGVYCFSNELLFKYLPEIEDDETTEELNVIKLVQIMKQNNHKIQALKTYDKQEFLGVNDRLQLNESAKWLQHKLNLKHMENGVTIMDPVSTYIGPDVVIEPDVTIYPNNHIYGRSTIASGTTILPNNWLDDVVIGSDTTIESSKITNSSVGNNATVGPNAHIRMDSKIGNNTRVGNFVEFKQTTLGEDSSSAHLVYLGNTNVGKNVNIGCGVVTVNYDGKNKFGTVIEDGAFVGSNSNLIAPIHIGKDAVVAAGSTLTDDVLDGDLAIARPRQMTKVGYGKKFKNKEEK